MQFALKFVKNTCFDKKARGCGNFFKKRINDESRIHLHLKRLKCEISNPAMKYMFKTNNRITRTMCEICSKLKIKTVDR